MHKKSLWSGVAAGYAVSVLASLLTVPKSGKDYRRKLSSGAGTVQETPARIKGKAKSRSDKLYESGKIRYELLHGKLDNIRLEARIKGASSMQHQSMQKPADE